MNKVIDGIIYTEDMKSVKGVENKDIKKAVIADGVHTIGINAFSGCKQLEEIWLPNSLFSVKPSAFNYCISLVKVHLVDNMEDLNSSWFNALPPQYELVCNPESTTYKLIKRSVKLKAHVKEIALADAKSEKKKQVQSASIEAVVFSALAQVEGSFFSILSSRKTATVVLIQIGKNCGTFRFGTDSAKWMPKIPKIIEILSDQEKEGAEIYKELKANKLTLSEVTSAGYVYTKADADGNFNLFMSGTLKGALKVKGDNTFSIFGARSIGYNAARSVEKFSSVVLSEGVERIEATAFQDCEKLKSITIPEGVKSIDYFAFHGCTSLTSVTLPESLEIIGGYAFQSCTSLSSIHIPKSIKTIGDNAFHCTNIENLGESFPLQEYDGASINFTIKDGFALKNSTLLYATSARKAELVIPEGVTRIDDRAFKHCQYLNSVKFPKSLKQIGFNAFEDTAILNLGKTYRLISSRAKNFEEGNLVDFTIKNGFAMEDDCLVYVTLNKRKALLMAESLVIPDFVKKIDDLGDSCKNVTSIFIPSSVKSIAFGAFSCCEKLAFVKYGGTKSQWETMAKNINISVKSVKCADGDIKL